MSVPDLIPFCKSVKHETTRTIPTAATNINRTTDMMTRVSELSVHSTYLKASVVTRIAHQFIFLANERMAFLQLKCRAAPRRGRPFQRTSGHWFFLATAALLWPFHCLVGDAGINREYGAVTGVAKYKRRAHPVIIIHLYTVKGMIQYALFLPAFPSGLSCIPVHDIRSAV
jgi:hypothetical protein